MGKNGFIRTSISVCTGLSAFQEIAKFPLIRTIFHFATFTFLCALLATGLRYFDISNISTRILMSFNSEFGAIRIEKDRLLPSKGPDAPRTVIIGKCRIDYQPNPELLPSLNLNDAHSKIGAIWTPKSISIWSKRGEDKFSYLLFRDFNGYHGDGIKDGNSQTLAAVAANSELSPDFFSVMKTLCPGGSLDMLDLKLPIVISYSAMVFINFFAVIIFLIPLFSLFSSLFYSFSGPELEIPSGFFNLANVAFYAGYPGILISALAFGTGIKVFDFQTFALVSFIAYFTFILSRSQKKNKNTAEEPTDYDEI